MNRYIKNVSHAQPETTDLLAVPPGVESQRDMSRQEKAAAARRRRKMAKAQAAWLTRVTALVDPEPYKSNGLCDIDVQDGDVGAALDLAIQNVIREMVPLRPDELKEIIGREGIDAEELERMTHNVALACRGRILAVVQASCDGPVVTRFAGDGTTC